MNLEIFYTAKCENLKYLDPYHSEHSCLFGVVYCSRPWDHRIVGVGKILKLKINLACKKPIEID